MPGLYTQGGWDHTRDFGAGLAVQAARDQAARLFSAPPKPQNDTPDVLMDRLQDDTLARWSDYLADLRVREFTTPDASVRILANWRGGPRRWRRCCGRCGCRPVALTAAAAIRSRSALPPSSAR